MPNRFPVEEKIKPNTPITARKDGGPSGVYLGSVQIEDGSWRHLIKHQIESDGKVPRYRIPRYVTDAAIVGFYDMKPFGWKPIEKRAQEKKEKATIHAALVAQVENLTRQVEELKSKLGHTGQ